MKKLFSVLLPILSVNMLSAALHVHMYSTPVTVIGNTTTPMYHYIDAENDGIDDAYFKVEADFGTYDIVFRETNGQTIESEYINPNSNWQALAYNCQANFGAGNNWTNDDVILAEALDDLQYDGKGPRYLPVRKQITYTPSYTYVYGWVKIECSQDASQFTVYGFAYDDEVVYGENYTIKAGEGECFGVPTAIDEPSLPADAVIACNGLLKINFPQPLQLQLFDAIGRLVTRLQSAGGAEEFNLPGTTGLYLVHISGAIKPKTIKLVL